jgi:hypothetical protein
LSFALGLPALHHRIRKHGKVDRPQFECPSLHPRIGKHVLDELVHLLHAAADIGDEVPAFVVEALAVLVEEQLTVSVDSTQRRLQVMRYRIRKRLEFPVGCLQIHGALGNSLFELLIEHAQIIFRVLLPRNVEQHPMNTGDLAGIVATEPRAIVHPDPAPVGSAQAILLSIVVGPVSQMGRPRFRFEGDPRGE